MKSAMATVTLLSLIGAGDAGKADLQRMQGMWQVVFLEIDGKAAGDKEKDAPIKVFVAGNDFFTTFADKPLTAGKLTLDAAQSPGYIDAEQTKGPWKGMTQLGLYEIKGEEMKIIWAEPNKERPKSFKTQAGTGQVLLAYKRVKEK